MPIRIRRRGAPSKLTCRGSEQPCDTESQSSLPLRRPALARRRVGMLVFDDFQLLDSSGPMAVFEVAGQLAARPYSLQLYAKQAGAVRSSSGVQVLASALSRAQTLDTLLIAGGDGVSKACEDARLLRSLSRHCTRARRVASICSGAYLLATTGLLDGRRATTHWLRCRDFAQRFPQVRLEGDRIFVRDGQLWSSAGITAGIDLALALVEQDLGEEVAQATARQLVVYYRRPGGQSQFSSVQSFASHSTRFSDLVRHVEQQLHASLSVPELAQRMGMSPRSFSRHFVDEMGMPPAKWVERLRVERARSLLREAGASVQEVALHVGFGDAERMRRAFHRVCGVSPRRALDH